MPRIAAQIVICIFCPAARVPLIRKRSQVRILDRPSPGPSCNRDVLWKLRSNDQSSANGALGHLGHDGSASATATHTRTTNQKPAARSSRARPYQPDALAGDLAGAF
jgi:hypothetical protein